MNLLPVSPMGKDHPGLGDCDCTRCARKKLHAQRQVLGKWEASLKKREAKLQRHELAQWLCAAVIVLSGLVVAWSAWVCGRWGR